MSNDPKAFCLKYPGWFEKRQAVRAVLDRINNVSSILLHLTRNGAVLWHQIG